MGILGGRPEPFLGSPAGEFPLSHGRVARALGVQELRQLGVCPEEAVLAIGADRTGSSAAEPFAECDGMTQTRFRRLVLPGFLVDASQGPEGVGEAPPEI